MRYRSAIPLLFLAAGVGLVTMAVLTGEATLYLLLVVPVVTGSSPLLLLGVACLFLGFLAIPFALGASGFEGEEPLPHSSAESRGASGGWGGVVLVGPLPLFFGRWRGMRGRGYWLAVLAGALLVVVALAVLLWVRP